MTLDDIRLRDAARPAVGRLSRGDLETAYRVARRDRHALLDALKGHGVCEENMDAEIARLLAEVDRLMLASMSEGDYLNGQRHERARILAAIEAQAPDGTKSRDFAYALGWDNAIAAILAAIGGDAP